MSGIRDYVVSTCLSSGHRQDGDPALLAGASSRHDVFDDEAAILPDGIPRRLRDGEAAVVHGR